MLFWLALFGCWRAAVAYVLEADPCPSLQLLHATNASEVVLYSARLPPGGVRLYTNNAQVYALDSQMVGALSVSAIALDRQAHEVRRERILRRRVLIEPWGVEQFVFLRDSAFERLDIVVTCHAQPWARGSGCGSLCSAMHVQCYYWRWWTYSVFCNSLSFLTGIAPLVFPYLYRTSQPLRCHWLLIGLSWGLFCLAVLLAWRAANCELVPVAGW